MKNISINVLALLGGIVIIALVAWALSFLTDHILLAIIASSVAIFTLDSANKK